METKLVLAQNYLDFRKFLVDLYKDKLLSDSTCTVRKIAKAAGYSSSSFWNKIIEGEIALKTDAAIRLSRFFKLSKLETNFFIALVNYNQAKTEDEKRYYLEELLAFQNKDAKLIEPGVYKLFSEWYYAAILELTACIKITDNYSEVSDLFQPKITQKQVKKALTALEFIGLIKKDEQGVYNKINTIVSTGENWKSIAVATYQRKVLELAELALSNIDKNMRDISTLTISISLEAFNEIKNEIHTFRNKVLSIAAATPNPSEVYQTVISFFPLTKQRQGDYETH
jgi:uncharacterized protein (TIGR02147 family)